jgi:hypothetical protein
MVLLIAGIFISLDIVLIFAILLDKLSSAIQIAVGA